MQCSPTCWLLVITQPYPVSCALAPTLKSRWQLMHAVCARPGHAERTQGMTLEEAVGRVLAAGGPVAHSVRPDTVRLHDDKVGLGLGLERPDTVRLHDDKVGLP
jgi:hypothetical protein